MWRTFQKKAHKILVLRNGQLTKKSLNHFRQFNSSKMLFQVTSTRDVSAVQRCQSCLGPCHLCQEQEMDGRERWISTGQAKASCPILR